MTTKNPVKPQDTDQESSQDKAPDQALDIGASEGEGEVLDFTGVSNYDPVPEDKPYFCTISKFDIGPARKGQGKTATVEVTVNEPVEWESRRIIRYYSLLPQSLFSIYNLIVAAGADPDKIKVSDFVLNPQDYLGMPLVAFAVNNTYQGETRSNIRRTAPSSEWGELKKMWDEVEVEEVMPF